MVTVPSTKIETLQMQQEKYLEIFCSQSDWY